MAKLGKYILASRIARQMLAEKAEEARQEGDMEFDDPGLKDLREKNPPKVEDKTKAESGVAKPIETAPKGKGTPKAVSDKELKSKEYTNLSNYVPARVKRCEKDETPTVTFDFDDAEIEGNVNVFPKEGDTLEKHFDKKHIIKLKETLGKNVMKEFQKPSKRTIDNMWTTDKGGSESQGVAPMGESDNVSVQPAVTIPKTKTGKAGKKANK